MLIRIWCICLLFAALCSAQSQSNVVVTTTTATDFTALNASQPLIVNKADKGLYFWNATTSAFEPLSVTTVYKTAITTKVSNAVLSADPTLQLALTPNKFYTINVWVLTAANTTAPNGIRFRYNITGGAPQSIQVVTQNMSTYCILPCTPTLVNAMESGATGLTRLMTNAFWGWIQQRVVVQANASLSSTFTFEWAQNTSSADGVSVMAGSYLTYIHN